MTRDTKVALGILGGIFLAVAIPAMIMGHGDRVGAFIWMLVMMAAYVVPSIVAARRKAKYLSGIVLTNILLGWTFIGWVGALIWAVSSPEDTPHGPRTYAVWTAESK